MSAEMEPIAARKRTVERAAFCPFSGSATPAAIRYDDLFAIVDSALEPFVSMDGAGRVLEWNSQAKETFGWSREEAMGRLVAELIVPPELRDTHTRALARFRLKAHSNVIGRRVRMSANHRDGRSMNVELRVGTTLAEDGTPTFHAFIRDVSALESARADAENRSAHLDESQRVAHLGSYEHDLANGTVRCTDELLAIIGLDRSTYDGSIDALLARIHPDDRDRAVSIYVDAVKARIPYELEHRVVRPNGTQRIVRRRGYVTGDTNGRAVRSFATVLDVTDQRRAESERRVLELRFARAFEEAPFGMAMIGEHAAERGCLLLVNRAFCDIVGADRIDVLGENYRDLAEPHDAGLVDAALHEARERGESPAREIRLRARSGAIVWIRQRVSVVRDDAGSVMHYVLHAEDVTKARLDRAALDAMHERLRRSIEDAPIGMALMRVETESRAPGTFLHVNAALCRLVGLERDSLLGVTLAALVDPLDAPLLEHALGELFAERLAVVATQVRYRRAAGTAGWINVHVSLVRDAAADLAYAVVQIVDITDTKLAESRLRHLAHHDSLTELLNRRGLEHRLQRHFQTPSGRASTSALLLIDLDYFKYVNDTRGHSAGDRLLRAVAAALRASAGPSDIVGRFGGDEFVVLLADTNVSDAPKRADGLRTAISAAIEAEINGALLVTASVGIVMCDGAAPFGIEDALAAADAALAEAKERGRNRVHVSPSLVAVREQMRARLDWADRIRSALREGAFRLYRQPIVALTADRVTRYELLLRMIGPDGLVIAPGSFLGEAERFGMMPEIDNWVVTEAIRICAADQQAGRETEYEVNLSGASLSSDEVLQTIEAEIARRGVSPERLVFEITETIAIRSMEKAAQLADRLSAIGCRVALDDFGAGFSSFYYLKRLPFSYLKIDGEFIADLATNASDRHIVRSIAQLAKGLGKKTIAEFVGNADAVRLLTEYGVDYGQGYFLGKPEPFDV